MSAFERGREFVRSERMAGVSDTELGLWADSDDHPFNYGMQAQLMARPDPNHVSFRFNVDSLRMFSNERLARELAKQLELEIAFNVRRGLFRIRGEGEVTGDPHRVRLFRDAYLYQGPLA